jgi:hypothetical protein
LLRFKTTKNIEMLKNVPYWQHVYSKYTDNKEAESITIYNCYEDLFNFLYKKRYVFHDQNGVEISRFFFNNKWYVYFKQSTNIKEYGKSIHVNFYLFEESRLEDLGFLNPYFFIDLFFKAVNPFRRETPTKKIQIDAVFEMKLDTSSIQNIESEKTIPLKEFLVKLLLGNLDYDTIISSRGHLLDIHLSFRKFCLVHNNLKSAFANYSNLLNVVIDLILNVDTSAYAKLLLDNINTEDFDAFTESLLIEAQVFNLLFNNEIPDDKSIDTINTYLKKQENNTNYNQSYVKTRALYYRLTAIKYYDVPLLNISLIFDVEINSVIYELFKGKINFNYKLDTVSILLQSSYLDDLTITNLPHDFKTTIALNTLECFDYQNNKINYGLFKNCFKYAVGNTSLETLKNAIINFKKIDRENFIDDVNLSLIEKEYKVFENDKVKLFDWLVEVLEYENSLRDIIEKVWKQRVLKDKSCISSIIKLSNDFIKKNIDTFVNIENEDRNQFLEYFINIYSITGNDQINNAIKNELKKHINIQPPSYSLKLNESVDYRTYLDNIHDMSTYALSNQVINCKNDNDEV